MAFGNLAKFAPTGTVKYTLSGITLGTGDQEPVLEMRHAGESNPGYWSAIIAFANELRARGAGTGKETPRSIREDREHDIELFSRHIITAWEHVYEDDGKPAPCTPEKVRELLGALLESRPDVLTRLFAFGRNAYNFDGGSLAASGAALGKS